MYQVLLRDYEVSIWTLQDSFISVLKPSGSNIKGQLETGSLNIKDDGTLDFNFKIPIKYRNESGVLIDNPLWSNVINGNIVANMRKIKLIFNRDNTNEKPRIYELEITKVTEDHTKDILTCKVETQGLAFHELGKIGYKIYLSQDDLLADLEKWFKAKPIYDAEKNFLYKSYTEEGVEETLYQEPIASLSYWNDKIFKPGDKWTYEIRMDYTGNNAGLGLKSNEVYEDSYIRAWKYDTEHDMIVGSEAEQTAVKARLIDVSESNLYNITQELAKTFGVFCRYEYEHDDQYYITGRKVVYYNNFLSEGEGTFDITYPYDARQVSRTSDSTDIVTKMYVQPDTSSEDYITIMNSPVNKTREDYILNFDYLHLTGAITDTQYEEVKNFEKNIARINLSILPISNQINALRDELPDLEAQKTTLTNAVRLDQEQLSQSGELLDLITDGTGEVQRNEANPEIAVVLQDSRGNNYITFSTKGIIVESVKIFTEYNYATQELTKQILGKQESGDSTQSDASTAKTTYSYDEYSNLTRITSSALPSAGRVYITYTYNPQLYTDAVKKLWDTRLSNDLKEKAAVEDKINSINEQITSLNIQYQAALEEKRKLLANFEYLMGPALREGYWAPEEYKDYGETYNLVADFLVDTPLASENGGYLTGEQEGVPIQAKLIYDTVPFENEFVLETEEIDGTNSYLPIIPITSQVMFKWIQEHYDNFSVVFDSSRSQHEEKTELIYKHIYTIGSQCRFGIINYNITHNNITYQGPTLALILNGAKSLSPADLSILMGEKSNLHLAVLGEMELEGSNVEISEVANYNDDVWVFMPQDGDSTKLLYPRIQVNSLQLRTTSDQLVIKTIKPGKKTMWVPTDTTDSGESGGSGDSGEGGAQPAFDPDTYVETGKVLVVYEDDPTDTPIAVYPLYEPTLNTSSITRNRLLSAEPGVEEEEPTPEEAMIEVIDEPLPEQKQEWLIAGNGAFIEPGDQTILDSYRDYSILSRENGYFLTINPAVFVRDGMVRFSEGGTGNQASSRTCEPELHLDIHYVISNAESVIYLDALQISKENAYPKVSYDVKLNIINQKFLVNSFDLIGRIVNINDLDLNFEHVQGYVSEVKINLDAAQNDELVIKNYKTKFEDLFTSIVAQTESMQKNANVIAMAAATFTPTGTISPDVMANSIRRANLDYAFNNGTLTISDTDGIWANSEDGVVAMRGGGIFTATKKDDEGNWLWNTGIVPSGINADLITAGQLDTNRIKIYAGDEVKFQMNGEGIFAYKSNGSDLVEKIPDGIDSGVYAKLVDQIHKTYSKRGVDAKQYVVYNSEGLFLKAKAGAQVGITKDEDDNYKIQETTEDVDRVSISWDGLTLKNYAGQKTFYADAETGNLTLKGDIIANSFKLANNDQNEEDVFILNNNGEYTLNTNVIKDIQTNISTSTSYYCTNTLPSDYSDGGIKWKDTLESAVQSYGGGEPYYQITRIGITSNGTTTYSYTCSRIAKDGTNGDGGVAGRGIQSITNYYLATTNNTAPEKTAEGWKQSFSQVNFSQSVPYLWGYELTTYTTSTNEVQDTSSTNPHLIAVWGQDGAPAPITYNISCVPNVLIANIATTLQVSITSSDGSTPTGFTTMYKVDGTEPTNSTIQGNSIACFGDSGITPQDTVTLILKKDNKIIDQQTIPVLHNGENGEDAYTLILSNENDTFIQGTTEQNKTTKLTLYKGIEKVDLSNITPPTYSYSTANLFSCSATPETGSNEAKSLDISIVNKIGQTINSINVDGYIDIGITYNDLTFTKRFSYASIIQGRNGTNAATYNIVPSSTVIIKDENNNSSLTPSSLTVTATVTSESNNNITSTAYGGYVTYQINDGSETGWPMTNNALSALSINDGTNYIIIRLYSNSTKSNLLDQQTVPVISQGKDGQDAYTLVLTNDNDSFIQGPSPQTKRTSLKLYNGITDNTDELRNVTWNTSNYKIECSDTENIKVTPVYNSTTNTVDFTITNSFANTNGGSVIDHNVNQGGTVTITIVYNDVTLSKVFSYSSVIQGTNALTYTLLPSASIIAYDGSSYTPATISATGYKSIGETIMTELSSGDTWSITYKIDDGNTQVLDGSITISAGTKQITFYLNIDNKIVDYQTVPVVSKGVDGKDGVNAYTVILTNENDSFVSGQSKTISTEVLVYKGTTAVPYGSASNPHFIFDSSISNNVSTNNNKVIVTFTNSNPTVDGSYSIPVKITEDGTNYVTITKQLSYSVVENGKNGVGIKEIQEYYKATAAWVTPASPISSTDHSGWLTSTSALPYSASIPYLWNVEVIVYTDSNKADSVGKPRLIGIYHADTLEVEVDSSIVKYEKNGSFVPNTLRTNIYEYAGLSRVAYSGTGTTTWYYDSADENHQLTTNKPLVLSSYSQLSTAATIIVTFSVDGNVKDTQTIPILRDGADGQGQDSYTAVFSNEQYTFMNAADLEANTSLSVEFNVQFYKGTTSQTITSISCTNGNADDYVNVDIDDAKVTVTYPKNNAPAITNVYNGTLTFNITGDNNTVTKNFSYTILPPKEYFASDVESEYITEVIPIYCKTNSATPPARPYQYVAAPGNSSTNNSTNTTETTGDSGEDTPPEEDEIVDVNEPTSDGEPSYPVDTTVWYRTCPDYSVGAYYYTSTMCVWSGPHDGTVSSTYNSVTYYCTFSDPVRDQSITIAMAGKSTALEVAQIIGRFDSENNGINSRVPFGGKQYDVALTSGGGLLIGANDQIAIKAAADSSNTALVLNNEGISLTGANIIMSTINDNQQVENVISMRSTTVIENDITQAAGITIGSTGSIIIDGGSIDVRGGNVKIASIYDSNNELVTPGSLTLNGGNLGIYSNGNLFIDSDGYLSMNGGTLNLTSNNGIIELGDQLFISGTSFEAYKNIIENGNVPNMPAKYFIWYEQYQGQFYIKGIYDIQTRPSSSGTQIVDPDGGTVVEEEIIIQEPVAIDGVNSQGEYYQYWNTNEVLAKAQQKLGELRAQALGFYVDSFGSLYCNRIICQDTISCGGNMTLSGDITDQSDLTPTSSTATLFKWYEYSDTLAPITVTSTYTTTRQEMPTRVTASQIAMYGAPTTVWIEVVTGTPPAGSGGKIVLQDSHLDYDPSPPALIVPLRSKIRIELTAKGTTNYQNGIMKLTISSIIGSTVSETWTLTRSNAWDNATATYHDSFEVTITQRTTGYTNVSSTQQALDRIQINASFSASTGKSGVVNFLPDQCKAYLLPA